MAAPHAGLRLEAMKPLLGAVPRDAPLSAPIHFCIPTPRDGPPEFQPPGQQGALHFHVTHKNCPQRMGEGAGDGSFHSNARFLIPST